ncbi:V(D)J recombination-activating protein 1 [Frankliniella fusca]|uniref:V(D)J recombination-activating protein 1 n=1 Tax=Frankliniella fusca TaxID=407009 RepID=A0AAE1L7B4_9NEOP|nr:V(D)J recombination-activating protein 1 [Frankliniella fusca]
MFQQRVQENICNAGPSMSPSSASEVESDHNDENSNLINDNQEDNSMENSTEDNTVTICLNDEGHLNDRESDMPLQERLEKSAVEVLIQLRSTSSLTGKAIERFQSGCKQMLQQHNAGIQAHVSHKLQEMGLSLKDIKEVFSEIQNVGDPFSNLKSIDDQLDFFAKEFGLVKPVEKLLDTRIDKRMDPVANCQVPTQVKETFQYISVMKTLINVLKNKKIRDMIMMSQASSDDIKRSYADGERCKNHSYIQRHRFVVQIILYFDELEVANSLGSKTIIHKLASFFFQIINLPPEISSKLSSIFLVSLAHADDLKKPGAMEKIFTPLVHELKRMSSEDGITVEFDGDPFTFRVVLVALVADTPAAHDVLGFMGVGAKYFCRRCLITRQQIRENANFIGPLRNLQQHEEHVLEVSRNPRFSSQCGVKRSCPLSKVPFFDPTSSSVFDAFHDLLECVTPFIMKLVLRHFVYVQKYFIIDDLNVRIGAFNYGLPDWKNKPSVNITIDMLCSPKGKLKQTGSQMWCLARALPFLIGDWVPENDPYMKQLFLLQDIMQIILAFEVRDEDINRLEDLITEHNDNFMRLFVHNQDSVIEVQGDEDSDFDADDPGEEVLQETEQETGRKMSKVYVTNTLHHLKHYPEMMRQYGPVVRFWCAKFEGRMKIFRQHASICNNFRNIPMTMSKMFQLSNVKTASGEFCDNFLDYQKGYSKSVGVSSHQILFHKEGLADTDTVIYTNSATVNGVEYRPGLFVCLGNSPSNQPKFALVIKVIVSNKNVFLILKPWETIGKCTKYNDFKVCALANAELTIKRVSALSSDVRLVSILYLIMFKLKLWSTSENFPL